MAARRRAGSFSPKTSCRLRISKVDMLKDMAYPVCFQKPPHKWRHSAEFAERLTQLSDEDRGSFECREVTSFGRFIPIEELRVDPLGPKLQWPVQLSGED